MSAKQKNTQLLLLVALVCMISLAIYTLALPKAPTLPFSVALSGKSTMTLGQSTLFTDVNHQDAYLYLELGANDSYIAYFHHEKGTETLVIHSTTWAETLLEDGSVPILHLIPQYVQNTQYHEISLVPMAGDGDYYVQNLKTVGEIQDISSPYNLIDFEIKLFDITISQEDYEKLAQERAQALDLGILFTDDDSFVNADILAEGEKYATDLRLKGDWTDHLQGDQWSFRVEVKGDYAIWGLQKFSLQPVATRNGIWEYLIYELYREQGGVAIRYDFADVIINGVYMGVYALEEFTEKRVLENSLQREGPIIKLNEGPLWTRFAYYNELTAPWHEYRVSSQKKTVTSETLDLYTSYAISLVNQYKAGEELAKNVFDIEKIIELSAILDLFSSNHGRIEHNLRFYYNPITARLEPLPFDEEAQPGLTDFTFYSQEESGNDLVYQLYDVLMADILSDPQNLAYSQETIRRLAQDMDNFFLRQESQIQQFTTTIQRTDPEFTMDVTELQPRIDQVIAPENFPQPDFYFAFLEESQSHCFAVTNYHPTTVFVDHLEIIGESIEETSFSVAPYETKIIHLSQERRQALLSWRTPFSQPQPFSLGISLAFTTLGHVYGDIYNETGEIHPPVQAYLENTPYVPLLDFALLTGDLRNAKEGHEFAQINALMSEISLPFFVAPGNHDLISQEYAQDYPQDEVFFQYFQDSFGYQYENQQLIFYVDIYENPETGGSFLPQEQLDMVSQALAEHPNPQNIFLAMHQLMFLDFSQLENATFQPNSLYGYGNTGENNFYSALVPLLESANCPVYVIAGDTGAFDNGMEIYYETQGQFTYVSTGVGGGARDSALEFFVFPSGDVTMRLVALGQDDPYALGQIQDYALP